MRAVVFRGPEQLRVEDVALESAVRDGWVRVRVRAAGLCGSDTQKLLGGEASPEYVATQILGHEIAGEVAETTAGAVGLGVGDRVVVEPLVACGRCDACVAGQFQRCTSLRCVGRDLRGGFAEYVDVPAPNAVRLPDAVPFSEAILLDPLAVCIHAVHCCAPSTPGWRAAIVGDGALALLLAQVCRVYGAEHVSMIAKHPSRQPLAESLGVAEFASIGSDGSVHSLRPSSVDVAFEVVGRRQSDSLAACIRLARPGGTVGALGVYGSGFDARVPVREAFYKEVRIVGSNSYGAFQGRREFDEAVDLARRGAIQLSPLVTCRRPLEDFVPTLQSLASIRGDTVKVVFEP